MRTWLAAVALFGLSACQSAHHDFPASAKTQFDQSCPANDSLCACTWDQITRAMTYDEYRDALDRFRTQGLMDPHITHARAYCLEHKRT